MHSGGDVMEYKGKRNFLMLALCGGRLQDAHHTEGCRQTMQCVLDIY